MIITTSGMTTADSDMPLTAGAPTCSVCHTLLGTMDQIRDDGLCYRCLRRLLRGKVDVVDRLPIEVAAKIISRPDHKSKRARYLRLLDRRPYPDEQAIDRSSLRMTIIYATTAVLGIVLMVAGGHMMSAMRPRTAAGLLLWQIVAALPLFAAVDWPLLVGVGLRDWLRIGLFLPLFFVVTGTVLAVFSLLRPDVARADGPCTVAMAFAAIPSFVGAVGGLLLVSLREERNRRVTHFWYRVWRQTREKPPREETPSAPGPGPGADAAR